MPWPWRRRLPVAQENAQKEAEKAPTTAKAGEDPTSDVTTIVVTGIRAALETAAETKRNADTFVDSVSASDVASLPDMSVAEALQRVPGVTVTRFPFGGASPDFPSPEGRGNLIRGLGFVRSEFNGRDAFSANGGRALDWSSIPPELVGAIDVYKNQSADLIEGGIGGTINLRTLQPFDREGHVLAITADATYGDLGENWAPSYSFMAGNRWDTDAAGEFGVLASYSSSEADLDDQRLAARRADAAHRSVGFRTVGAHQVHGRVGRPDRSLCSRLPVANQ